MKRKSLVSKETPPKKETDKIKEADSLNPSEEGHFDDGLPEDPLLLEIWKKDNKKTEFKEFSFLRRENPKGELDNEEETEYNSSHLTEIKNRKYQGEYKKTPKGSKKEDPDDFMEALEKMSEVSKDEEQPKIRRILV